MRRLALLVAAVASWAALAGCGGKQALTSPSGLGGAPADAGTDSGSGGTRATGSGGSVGHQLDGAVPPAGSIDAGTGTETTCVTDGGPFAASDAGTPNAPADAGVCAELPPDAPTFPWMIEPQAGTGGAGGTGSPSSGCQTTRAGGEIVDVVCSGAAWLRPNGGSGGTGGNVPSVTWDDGSRLSWQPTGLDPSIAPPIAQGAADQRVWAQLESHGWLAVPGQCGWIWNQSMDLRDTAGGNIRFLARQGASLPEPSSADLTALFGVGAQTVTSCTHDVPGGPALFHQTLNAHVLQTMPAQMIPYEQPTQVTAPNGTFAVLWYSRTQTARPLSTTCAGCLTQGPIVGMVASLLGPGRPLTVQ